MIRPSLLPVVALLCWGLWATVVKYGAVDSNPVATALCINLVATPLYIGYGMANGYAILPTEKQTLLYLGVAGLFSGLGTIAYYTALSRGVATSTATTVSALYFLVPAILAFFALSETVTLKESIGIVAAVVATVLLTG